MLYSAAVRTRDCTDATGSARARTTQFEHQQHVVQLTALFFPLPRLATYSSHFQDLHHLICLFP